MSPFRPGVERMAVALIPAGIGAALLYAILSGLGAGELLAAAVATALALAGAALLARRLPSSLDGVVRRRPVLAVAWFALGVASVGVTARLATFMVDETRASRSIIPFDEFFVHHSCLSAHYQSAQLQRDGVANVYERTNYEGPEGEPKFLNSLVIDVFLYPPPMLLLSRTALALSDDFTVWRAVWFGLEGAMVALALIALAVWIGGEAGRRAALFAPLVWLSIPTLITLQYGNLHLAAIAAALFAMLAFERGRPAVGGALLGALTLFKIFPGILLLLLVFQRRWRSVAWTVGFALVILIAAVAFLGRAPFDALFSYQLPRLASGAAFESIFAHPDAIADNESVYGMVQKLSLLGMPGMSTGTAVAVTWVYTIALIVLAAIGARGSSARLPRALVWLSLIQLASLRSPFTPDEYALFAVLWILVQLLASHEWRPRRVVALAVLIVLANLVVPTIPIMPIKALLTVTLVRQLVFFALCCGVVVAWRRLELVRADSGGFSDKAI
jgi:alpha-1,2-mannosyltransferase